MARLYGLEGTDTVLRLCLGQILATVLAIGTVGVVWVERGSGSAAFWLTACLSAAVSLGQHQAWQALEETLLRLNVSVPQPVAADWRRATVLACTAVACLACLITGAAVGLGLRSSLGLALGAASLGSAILALASSGSILLMATKSSRSRERIVAFGNAPWSEPNRRGASRMRCGASWITSAAAVGSPPLGSEAASQLRRLRFGS